MSRLLDSLTADAMKLSPAERVELIERIADSVLPALPLHQSWEREIERRVAELDVGLVASVSTDQVLADLRRQIASSTEREP